MKRIRMDENGNAIDPETGNVIGRKGTDGVLRILPPLEAKAPDGGVGQTEQAGQDGNTEAKLPPDTPEKPQKTIVDNRKSATQTKPQTVYSRYEVNRDTEFTIRFCIAFREGRAIVLQEDARYKVRDSEAHWATFRMWTYREEVDWKNQVMEYDSKSRTFRQNTVRLDELKIRHLLKKWSFEEYDERFRLLHVNGYLSDESYDIFRGFFPSIIDSIIYMMNNVLESNG